MSVLFGMVTPGDVWQQKARSPEGRAQIDGGYSHQAARRKARKPELADFRRRFRRLRLDFGGPSRLIGPTKDNAAQKRGATCTPIAAIPAPI
ncbi:hypothetical protein [Pseudothioclava arenosa]|uniref:hypothetical protein n=1 Tax=Pseudothioclava arenosa TaxID=1795308 RepID=UPI00117E339B|nr:hypothetical protein [Pseudothioclava arenosa]